jgi:hypothetical protein
MTWLEMSAQEQHSERVIEPRNLNRGRDSDTSRARQSSEKSITWLDMLAQGQQREGYRASGAQQSSEQSMTRLEMSTQGQHGERVIEPRNLNRERDSDTLMRTTELRAVDDIARAFGDRERG